MLCIAVTSSVIVLALPITMASAGRTTDSADYVVEEVVEPNDLIPDASARIKPVDSIIDPAGIVTTIEAPIIVNTVEVVDAPEIIAPEATEMAESTELVLPPVPASAPEATAELVATSPLFQSVSDYPKTTTEELAALGDAVETPLYYTDPIDYDEDTLLWLARIIDREAESKHLTDIHQLLVGNVVLNRMASTEFPDDLMGVLFQPKAYGPNLAAEHHELKTPSDRALQNARRLLAGERFCPASVVFQANGKQGTGTFLVIYDKSLGTKSYFCYANHMQEYEH